MGSSARRLVLAAVAAGTLAGTMLMAGAGVYAADYGNTAQYQVEISANSLGPGAGGGAWLWIELDSGGSGTYTGSDCGHLGPGSVAVPDAGSATWTESGGTITIDGVVLNGLETPVTISVPSAYGNQRETFGQVFGIPIPGFAEVTVAP